MNSNLKQLRGRNCRRDNFLGDKNGQIAKHNALMKLKIEEIVERFQIQATLKYV